ncbi:MAG: hypothetical protein ACTHOH_14110 [Lysobacteraceae bacterium]
MTTPHAVPPPTTAELGPRLLALLAGLHGPDDLAPGAIERATGVAVRQDPADEGRYGFGVPLEPGWMCHLSALPNGDGAAPRRLVISYDPSGGNDAALPPSVPALDDVARSLVDAGYRRDAMIGPRNVLWGQVFTRDDVEIRVNVEVADPSADVVRPCVTRIAVDAAVRTRTFTGGPRHE